MVSGIRHGSFGQGNRLLKNQGRKSTSAASEYSTRQQVTIPTPRKQLNALLYPIIL